MKLVYGSHTDKGVRNENQDRLLLMTLPELSAFAIADGIGGLSCGAEAAEAAINSIKLELEESESKDPKYIKELLRYKLKQINEHLYSRAKAGYPVMGTTISVLVFLEDSYVLCNVGDTKIFAVRDNKLSTISMVHSHSKIRNILTMAVGPNADVEPYTFIGEACEGDSFILCSDGVYNYLEEDYLLKCSELEEETIEEAEELCKDFIEKALENNSRDNLSIILVKLGREVRE